MIPFCIAAVAFASTTNIAGLHLLARAGGPGLHTPPPRWHRWPGFGSRREGLRYDSAEGDFAWPWEVNPDMGQWESKPAMTTLAWTIMGYLSFGYGLAVALAGVW